MLADVKATRKSLVEEFKGLCDPAGNKTQYVAGDRLKVSVVFPSRKFNNASLKGIFHRYTKIDPEARDELLNISEVKVKIREFNKAEKTNGDSAYCHLAQEIKSAEESTEYLSVTVKVCK